MIYNLFHSTNPIKKYMVVFANERTGRLNKIHFGAFGLSDYTINKDKKRKELYKLRHANDYIDDLAYPGAFSWHLLWNKKTLEKSIIDMEKRFNITIVNNLSNHLENIHFLRD